ncbi:MAG: MBL fold metallo-hydrolase [Elusimicrobiota bacterium]
MKTTEASAPALQFLGAAGSVTGSKFLLQSSGREVLVDCGLFQGIKELRERNWNPLPIDAAKIDAVVLTHAHLDHSGYLPRLARMGYGGRVYCTRATAELLGLLLPDSGYLQEEQARYANRKGFSKHSPALPLYTKRDAVDALRLLEPVDYGEQVEVAAGIRVRLHPSGHILGAAFAELDFEGRRMVVSGDVGSYDRVVMRGPAPLPQDLDYILVESTYGGRRQGYESVQDQLEEYVKPVVEAGGVVVIPAFAVGRTTLIIYHLRQLMLQGKLPDVPVCVDSPMATDAVKIYRKYHLEHNLKVDLLKKPSDCPIRVPKTRLVRGTEESKELNMQKGPLIIVSASGMATGGRILHHLKHRLPERENLVLLVGYQVIGTRGRSLVDGAKEIKIHGQRVPVRAKVAIIHGVSAHGDSDDLVAWLKTTKSKPKRVFLVHGEPEGLRAMAKRVDQELGWRHHTAKYLEKVRL